MSPTTITVRAAIERALTAVGERLAHAGAPCSIIVLGGAAINLLGLVDRPTRDVDVLATAASPGGPIGPPDLLPRPLHFQDLLALRPTDDELVRPAEWVKRQDVSADFHSVVANVVDHARRSLR